MELSKKNYLREDLEQKSTSQLEELLRAELGAEEPNDELVWLLTCILEERDQQNPDKIPIDGESAWVEYKTSQNKTVSKRKKKTRNVVLRLTAAAAVVCILVLAVPRAVNANNFFEMITQWTEDIFEFFTSGGSRSEQVEYVFQTDNEDLQQVYDAAVKMGVTDPAVPMWLPEECKLIEIKEISLPTKQRLFVRFLNGESEVTFAVDLCSTGVAYDYQKDDGEYSEYEYNGTVHYILNNQGVWTATWTKDEILCYITIECSEDTLYQIIDSIYTMEAIK